MNWLYHRKEGYLIATCPQCENSLPMAKGHEHNPYHFCPYCGKRLKEGGFKSMARTCANCHRGHVEKYMPECYAHNCIDNPKHPNWEPMTNADTVRLMNDEQLRDLWQRMNRGEAEWREWLGRRIAE